MNATEALALYNHIASVALTRYNVCMAEYAARLAWEVKVCFVGEFSLMECI